MTSRRDPILPQPSWRKPVGIAIILAIVILWSTLVVSQAERIGTLPALAQAVVYLIAGLAWIAPLKPLLRWMETGRLRA